MAGGEALIEMADAVSWQAVAYLREVDLPRIRSGSAGVFMPEGIDWPPIAGHVSFLAPTGSSALTEAPLFTQYGGNVPVRRDTQGRWIPTTALYRIVWRPNPPFTEPPHVLRGTLFLENQRAESMISRLRRLLLEVLIRETGF
ncbi:MAG: hypothetical protein HQM00_14025 [Magnetococcales bacterium]|nr:hypothetical protein [Magnetococcales bacterium]